ncbi:hypothetical protein ACFQV4_31795 [Streptomyces thermocarboxydus]
MTLHAVEDVGGGHFCDLLEFPPLDPDDEFGEELGVERSRSPRWLWPRTRPGRSVTGGSMPVSPEPNTATTCGPDAPPREGGAAVARVCRRGTRH